MGINGLLGLLKSIHKPCNLKKFAGQTLGVDAYGWLHRGSTACAVQLALGQHTTKYVEFAMNRVRMLIHFGVTPYIVFDGANLPSKAGTENERKARRAESRARGEELLRLGKTSQAHQELQKAVDVTPEMAGMLIQELKKAGVKYVVAPYEADAQLVYLERKGIINGIISEDSDMLVFGAKVLLTKLDQYGECVMIRRDDFTACREISLVGWSDRDFRRMAILSGCDYLDNIGKMGLKTAYRLMRKHKTVERVLQAVRLEGKMKVPADYHQNFAQAEMTFLYQWAYCPIAKGLVHCTTPDPGVSISGMPFIGEFVEAAVASGVARGELHPQSKQTLVLPQTRPPSGNHRSAQTKMHDQENTEQKKGVSIAEFFKPKRTPLAELEPNAFILTPRQQELARHASTTSWSSPLVQSIPRVDRENAPQIAPVASRRPLSTLGNQTPSLHRIKRQRLCQDELFDSVGTPMNNRSKFFTRPEKRKKKHMSSEFDIHSDDSVEEALLRMTNSALLKQETTVSSLQTAEADYLHHASLTDKDESQLTLVDTQSSSRDPAFEDTEETFVEEPSSSSGVFDKYVMDDLCTLTQTVKTEVLATTLVSTSKTISKQATTFSKPGTLIKVPIGDDGILDSAWEEADATVVVYASDAAEPPTSPKKPGRSFVGVERGSEDFLASDSEVSEGDEVQKIRSLNLRRFAFT